MQIAGILVSSFVASLCLTLNAGAADQPTADISGQWQFGWYAPNDPVLNWHLQHPTTGLPIKKSVCFFQQAGDHVTGTCDGCWVGDAAVTGTVNGDKFRLNAYMPGGHRRIFGSLDTDGTLKGSLPDGVLYYTAHKIPGSASILAQHACSWDFEDHNPL